MTIMDRAEPRREPDDEPVWRDDRPRQLDEKIRPREWQRSDVLELLGSAGAAVCLTWLLFFQLTALWGSPGFVLVAFAIFLPMYWFVEREAHGSLLARDRVATVIISVGGLFTVVPLVWVLATVFVKGIEFLQPNFLTQDMSVAGPLDPPGVGGAAHAIIGTLQQVAVAVVIAVPFGVMTAVYLNEVKGKLRRPVRALVDAMSGLPSIVAGLLIYATVVIQFGYSGLACGLALAILMLPSVTRTSEEMMRLVPDGLREASLALGAPEWRTTLLVVIPTARVGIITAIILGMARVVGETAPALLTAFGANNFNVSPVNGPQEDLPIFIWRNARSSLDGQVARGWTGALVLIVIVLILFTLARVIGSQRPGRLPLWKRAVLFTRRPATIAAVPADASADGDRTQRDPPEPPLGAHL